MDGQTTTNGNANNGDPAFKQLLGAASSLSNGPHTVVLTNTGSGSAVDLDSFIFQAQAGSGYAFLIFKGRQWLIGIQNYNFEHND